MITVYKEVAVPMGIMGYAYDIRLENYKVNTPTQYQIHDMKLDGTEGVLEQVSALTDIPVEKLDCVFFSVCRGAEPHVDDLDPEKYTGRTFTIPLVQPPSGRVLLKANGAAVDVRPCVVYEFDHTKIHSMELDDKEYGCTVLMIGELH